MLKSAHNFLGALQRFAFPLFVGLAIGLMVLSRIDNPTVVNVRAELVDVLAPVIDVMSRPTAAIENTVSQIEHFVDVYEENAVLRAENERLLHWQSVARQLDAENRQYSALLSTVVEPREAFVTVRIIGMSSGAFVKTAIVNAVRNDGIQVGQAVTSADGILGRVIEVCSRSARVLLLTDLNSRVPVMVQQSRAPAVLAGDNSDVVSLVFAADGAAIAVGDRLVTSGEGGLLPPGLPVGVVTGREGGVWRVRLFADPARVEYARVLDYALPGLLPAAREAGAAGELW